MRLFCIFAAAWLMAKIERRPTTVYGLGGKNRLRNTLAGLGWGVALLSLLVFTLRARGLLDFDARLLFGAGALRSGAAWLVGFVVLGVFEEYFFRGYMQFTLARGINGIYGWLHAAGLRSTDEHWASGPRPFCSHLASDSCIGRTRASRPSDCWRPR